MSACIDIIRPFIRSSPKNQRLLLNTYRFSKISEKILRKVIWGVEVAKHFLKSWVLNYGPLDIPIADNGGWFTSKFFQEVYRIMYINNKYTTTHHPKQMGRYTNTIAPSWQHYERT